MMPATRTVYDSLRSGTCARAAPTNGCELVLGVR